MKVILLLTVVASLWKDSSAVVCYICGEGKQVGNEAGIVNPPTGANRTCGELLAIADQETIEKDQCDELTLLLQEPCECEPYICDVCGEGKVSTNPGATIDIPGDDQGNTTCLAVYEISQAGGFNQTFCPTVQTFIEDPCGCEEVKKPTRSPTSPTAIPATSPTGSPGSLTLAPQVSPTEPPTSDASTVQHLAFVVTLAATSIMAM